MKKETKLNAVFLCHKEQNNSDENEDIINKIKDKKEVIYDEFHNFNEFNYNLLNDPENFKKLDKNILKKTNLHRNSIKNRKSLKNFLPLINSNNNKNIQNEKNNKKINKSILNLTLKNYQYYKTKKFNSKNKNFNFSYNNDEDAFYNKFNLSQKNINTTNNTTLLNSLNTTNKLNDSLINNNNSSIKNKNNNNNNNNENSLNSNRSISKYNNNNKYKLKIKEGLINLNYNNNKLKNKLDKRKNFFNNIKENFDLRYKRAYFKYILSDNQKELIPENIDYKEILFGKQTFLKKLDRIITKLKGDIIIIKESDEKHKDYLNIISKRKKNEKMNMNKIERLLDDNQNIAKKIV